MQATKGEGHMAQLNQGEVGSTAAARPTYAADITLKTAAGQVYSGPGALQAQPGMMSAAVDSSTLGTPVPALDFPADTYLQGFPSPYGSVLVTTAAPQPDYYPVALVCKAAHLKGTLYLQQSYLSPEPAGWPPESQFRQTVMVAFNDGRQDVVMPILDYVVRWNTWGAVQFVSSGDTQNSHVLNAWAPDSPHWASDTYPKVKSFPFDCKAGDTIAIIGVAAGAWNNGGGGVGIYAGEWGEGPIVDGTERSGLNHTWVFAGGDTLFMAGDASRSVTYSVTHGTSHTNSWKLSLQLGATVREGVVFASATQTTQLTTAYSGSYTVTDQKTVSETYTLSGDPKCDSRAGVYQLYDAYGVNMPRVMSYFDYVAQNLPKNLYGLQCNGKPVTLSSLPLGQLGFGFEQPIAFLPTQSPGGDPATHVVAMTRVWKYCSAGDNRQCKQP
jgi:hypothetical protein